MLLQINCLIQADNFDKELMMKRPQMGDKSKGGKRRHSVAVVQDANEGRARRKPDGLDNRWEQRIGRLACVIA